MRGDSGLEKRVRDIRVRLLNFEVVSAVLTGESLRVVAKRFGLDQADVRLRVVRYCMAVNPRKWVELGNPSMDDLRVHRGAFLPPFGFENGSQQGEFFR